MARGEVDAVILGADRICANGDVVNKVGTYAHALGARAAGIPFLVVAPESTVDPDTPSGADVPIEDRDPAEVLGFGPTRVTPYEADAVNPAFDVTPHDLVTAVVSEKRVAAVRGAQVAFGTARLAADELHDPREELDVEHRGSKPALFERGASCVEQASRRVGSPS